MDYLKLKISEEEMNSFIKSWEDCELGLDLLIIKQQTANKKILKNLKTTQEKLFLL
jgi:hypothetical protein